MVTALTTVAVELDIELIPMHQIALLTIRTFVVLALAVNFIPYTFTATLLIVTIFVVVANTGMFVSDQTGCAETQSGSGGTHSTPLLSHALISHGNNCEGMVVPVNVAMPVVNVYVPGPTYAINESDV